MWLFEGKLKWKPFTSGYCPRLKNANRQATQANDDAEENVD